MDKLGRSELVQSPFRARSVSRFRLDGDAASSMLILFVLKTTTLPFGKTVHGAFTASLTSRGSE